MPRPAPPASHRSRGRPPPQRERARRPSSPRPRSMTARRPASEPPAKRQAEEHEPGDRDADRRPTRAVAIVAPSAGRRAAPAAPIPPAEVAWTSDSGASASADDVEHPAADAADEADQPARGCGRASAATAPGAAPTAAAARGGAVLGEQPQLSATAEASASTRPAASRHRRAPLERQVRLGSERGDADARQIAPPLVDDEPPLPAREELAVEEEQVVELELALQREQRAPLQLLQAGRARPRVPAALRTARS